MSYLPSGVVVNPGNPYFVIDQAQNVITDNSGLASNLTWTPNQFAPSTLKSFISVPGLISTNAVQCTAQPLLIGFSSMADLYRCPIIGATAGNNQIEVFIGDSNAPTLNSTFGVAWSVVA